MNHKRLFNLLFLLAVVLLVGLRSAEACSCSSPSNVLKAFDNSKNVVVLKAVAVEKSDKDAASSPPYGVKWTKMIVEKSYKGKYKAGDEINFAQGGGADCIWTFKEEDVGKRYLFYLTQGDTEQNFVWGYTCSRSRQFEYASDDLLYLEKLDKVRGKTRLSGKIVFESYASLDNSPPLEGRKIKITGGGRTFNLKTDKNGVYEIYDLPPGIYQIYPEIPKGWRPNQFYLRYTDVLGANDEDEDGRDKPIKEYALRLQPQGHAALDFHLEIDNRISGKVYGPDGKPMRGLCVRLYPPTGISKDAPYLVGCVERSEDTFEFEIDEIPPGRYILVANEENKLTSDEPFNTVYYPGTFELEKASVINIGVGEFLENINLTVPKIAEMITVQGVMLYADGKPVVDKPVRFNSLGNDNEYENDSRANTDAQGRFTLKIIKGMKGKLYGTMYTYISALENCPKLQAFIRETGKTSYDAKSQEIEIDGENNLFDVELRLPIPSCQKSKD